MLKDITIGQYYPGRSPIHLLDPRVKIIITFLFIFVVFFIKSYVGYAILFAYLMLIVILSTIPLKLIFKSLRPLLFVIVLTFVINMFSQ